MSPIRNYNAKIEQALAILGRAGKVIASSTSKEWPYESLRAETRIYCAILAAQARDMAERALSQLGLKPDSPTEGREWAINDFIVASAEYVGSDNNSMLGARVAAQAVLVDSARSLIERAERVLEGNETVDGRPIIHTDLSDK